MTEQCHEVQRWVSDGQSQTWVRNVEVTDPDIRYPFTAILAKIGILTWGNRW